MRPSVVLIVSSACWSCDSGSDSRRDEDTKTAPSTGEASGEAGPKELIAENPPRPLPGEPTLNRRSGMLNYVDSQGRTIYKGGPSPAPCFVHGPFPEGADAPPGMPPPRVSIACPEPMRHASWDACGGGWVSLKADGKPGECECHWSGNPPPPPEPMPCPETHDGMSGVPPDAD
jgi:hypothetical protein